MEAQQRSGEPPAGVQLPGADAVHAGGRVLPLSPAGQAEQLAAGSGAAATSDMDAEDELHKDTIKTGCATAAGPQPDGTTSAKEPLGTAAPLQRPVVLRVEVATKAQAALLTWIVVALNLVFLCTAVGVLVFREQEFEVGELRPYYTVELSMASLCLLVLLVVLAWMVRSILRSRQEQRAWSVRQRFFARTALVILLLQIGYTAAFVTSFSVLLAQPDCQYPWRVLMVFDYVQYVLFASQMMFILSRLKGMTLWRGPEALDMPPDFRLSVDRPLQEQAKHNRVIIVLWALLVLVSLARLIEMMIVRGRDGGVKFDGGCDVSLDTWECSPSTTQIIFSVVAFIVLVAYVIWWFVYLRRALKDHEQLPYCRYKSTLIFVRVKQRVLTPVLTAIFFSVIALSLVPAISQSCWGLIDSQMSNLTVFLSLTVAAAALAILYMPKAAVDSPVLQEFLQDFSWTRAAMPADIERRCQRLLASEDSPQAPPAAASSDGGCEKGGMVHPVRRALQTAGSFSRLAQDLARLAGIRDVKEAAEYLRLQPIFCMESAVKLFYWMRLAYRDEDALTHPFVNAHIALRLCGLAHFETVWDDTTDTHCAVGWSDTDVVVSFRGTQTLQNVITDAKSWRRPIPGLSRNGKPLKVHAGFLQAWLHSGFNAKVLQRLSEIDCGPIPLRFWITGHSLGGALAQLAALDIQREHPRSQLTCYVFGCPRVGNAAFAEEFEEAVPDGWNLINGLDPIPWVPKIGFRSSGKRVTINHRGDLILRPSYFELSVTHRGTSIKHHLAGSYALSLAAVLRAQFVASKAQPGGAEGVGALAAAVDLPAALVLTNLDLESLRDPEALPQSAEAFAAKQQAQLRRREESGRGAVDFCGGTCGWAPFSRGPSATGQASYIGDGGESSAGQGSFVGDGGESSAGQGSLSVSPSRRQQRRRQQQQQQQQQVLHLDCPDALAASPPQGADVLSVTGSGHTEDMLVQQPEPSSRSSSRSRVVTAAAAAAAASAAADAEAIGSQAQ